VFLSRSNYADKTRVRYAVVILQITTAHRLYYCQRMLPFTHADSTKIPHCKTNSVEVESRSPDQKIPRILRNTKVYYRVRKSLPMGPILRKLNPNHIPTPCVSTIHFKLIVPCAHRSAK